jgi:hypothetical protein
LEAAGSSGCPKKKEFASNSEVDAAGRASASLEEPLPLALELQIRTAKTRAIVTTIPNAIRY